MAQRVRLLVGLGNPGREYECTRHNAGFWFADAVARRAGGEFRMEERFHGEACKVRLYDHELWLLKPQTFMNRSGLSVAALSRFYKIAAEEILVAHDELDIPAGAVRLKQDGGHGGHNGLRDIIGQLSLRGFMRLRLGIGHPGHSSQVTNYVLSKAPQAERDAVLNAIEDAIDTLPHLLAGEFQRVMNHLHARK